MATLKIGKGFGKRLRKLRKAAGLTQAALGEKAGVHPVSIAQYETGACNPSEKTAARLRVYFEGLPDKPADTPAAEPEKKRRGRPRKATPAEGPSPETRAKMSESARARHAREKFGRTKKVAEKKVSACALAEEPSCPKQENGVIKTPARLGMVSKDWLDQQIEAHVHSRGMLFIDGPCRIVCMTKRDVAELCRIMLQVGGVQIRSEEAGPR